MTEAQWLACDDPDPLLQFAAQQVSQRKLRLFACACCRRVFPLLTQAAREAVRAAEDFADGRIKSSTLRNVARRAVDSTVLGATWLPQAGNEDPFPYVSHGASACATYAVRVEHPPGVPTGIAYGLREREAERVAQADQFRDVVGNPFGAVNADHSWLTSDVLLLARGAYRQRAFDRLPILADALQDAGCDSDDILNHCRAGGVHVRGCWVVDLLLGKE